MDVDTRAGTMTTVKATRAPTSEPAMAKELNNATIGAIVGVAAAMLATVIALVWCLVRQHRLHQRKMADLEERGNIVRVQQTGHVEAAAIEGVPINRPRNVLRRTTFLPFGTRTGWDTLESREDVSQNGNHHSGMPNSIYTRPLREKKRNSKRLSWPFSRQPVVLGQIPMQEQDRSRLTTVLEITSAKPLRYHPTTRDDSEAIPGFAGGPPKGLAGDGDVHRTIRRIASVSELRPDPLNVGKKRARAQTIAESSVLITPKTEPSKVTKRVRPSMHVRSFSLGSQSPGSAPQHGVPPLPLTIKNVEGGSRPKSCYERNTVSRASVSSLESIGSSLLASPRLQRSASEKSARLQTVARRDYANSLISGPRPMRPKVNKRPQSSPDHTLNLQSLRGSIKSNVESMQSRDGQRPLSMISTTSDADMLSLPSVKTAEAARMSRISLVPVGTPYQGSITPRRQSRITVSENGSPAQRIRPVPLREIPGNARLSRQLSQTSTSASSTRSSNGNPFQFDPSPMASGKPSALKGSPTARGTGKDKGHKRLLTVRLNLSPRLINPPAMADIQEESPENVAKLPQLKSSMGPLPNPPSSPRPPSTSTFNPQLKVRPSSFVASLTADSPTLPSMNFAQGHTRASFGSSTADKDPQRFSFSSIFIPFFPSPGKAELTTNVMPTPTFSYTRPSNEIERQSPSTEAMILLARPYSPRESCTVINATFEQEVESLKSSQNSTTGELIFPILEKEQLRAPEPPFDATLSEDLNLASNPPYNGSLDESANPSPMFVPQNWLPGLQSTEILPPISPPCSPKTSHSIIVDRGLELDNTAASQVQEDHPVTLPLHCPSPIPGLNVFGSSFLPKSQIEPPANDLCISIAELRRMNSDAKHDAQNPKLKAARRYQRMGRGEYPRISSRDSVASLCEIDEALDFGFEPSNDEGDDSIIYGDDVESESNKENSPSVWEDGENYWKSTSKPIKSIASSPMLSSSRDISPLSTGSAQNRDNMGIQSPLVHRRVSEMRGSAILDKLPLALVGIGGPGTPKVVVQPPSREMGTPTSLYDQNGFLRDR